LEEKLRLVLISFTTKKALIHGLIQDGSPLSKGESHPYPNIEGNMKRKVWKIETTGDIRDIYMYAFPSDAIRLSEVEVRLEHMSTGLLAVHTC